MTFAAVSAASVTLLIFGLFLVFAFNINYMASELDREVSIRVFLNASISSDEIDQVKSSIEKKPKVESVKFISKQEGLESMKGWFGEDEKFLKGLEKDNPIPDMLEVLAKIPVRVNPCPRSSKEIIRTKWIMPTLAAGSPAAFLICRV